MSCFAPLADDSADSLRETGCISRRDIVVFGLAVLGSVLVTGCQRSVTKYKPDGTPYTEKEDDWVATLAAVLLIAILVAAIAANRQDDDDASVLPRTRLFDGDDDEIIDSDGLFLSPAIQFIPNPTRKLCRQALRFFRAQAFELRRETPLVAVVVPHATRPDAFVLESIREVEESAQLLETMIVQTHIHSAHALRIEDRIEVALVPRNARVG